MEEKPVDISLTKEDANEPTFLHYSIIFSSLFLGVVLVGSGFYFVRRGGDQASGSGIRSDNEMEKDFVRNESEILLSVVKKWKRVEQTDCKNQSEKHPILIERKKDQDNTTFSEPLENSRIRSSLKIQLQKILETSKREIGIDSFHVGDQIGSGNFGKVYKGKIIGIIHDHLETTTVAIKTISDEHVNEIELENIMCEIKIMSSVDPHLNLVSMLASCSSEFLTRGKLWLLLEFCSYGDLKMFLIENRSKLCLANKNDELNNRCLILWAYDIANGMDYLFKKEIMHGDLAARNIMMDENPLKEGYPVAKIADFGLSKKFNDSLIYEKESRLFVPWRWMALEYLTESYFTLKSDVWSFGVLFWEILSLGKVPYGQQSYDEVLECLKNGYRLHFPDDLEYINLWSPVEVFKTISNKCFAANPEDRSTFSEIVEAIQNELSEEELIIYKSMNDKYLTARRQSYSRKT